MPPKERAVDRGTRRGRQITVDIGLQLRGARLACGSTQKAVGRPCGMSASYVGKIERGEARSVSITQYARLCSVVGLDLTVKAYPAGNPLRDAAHVALLARFRARIHPSWTWRTEVPIPRLGDLRSWDVEIDALPIRIGVEAETRMHDFQALDRRIMLKQRDSGVDHVLLILADSRANRAFLREFDDALRANYPLDGSVALAALAAGRDPGGNAIALL
jgi:transcriptional regulator with XRE-family HTH domain